MKEHTMVSTANAYCMKCRSQRAILDTVEDGKWWDGRPKLYGTCEVCGIRILSPLSPKAGAVRREQDQAEKNIAQLHSKAVQNAKEALEIGNQCPRCSGYMRTPSGEGLEIEVSCLNCGYSGTTIPVPNGYMLKRTRGE